MGIVPEILAALLFVGSTGIFFNEKFRRSRLLVLCAGTVALVSTYFLTEQLVRQFVDQRIAERSDPAAEREPRTGPTSVTPTLPPVGVEQPTQSGPVLGTEPGETRFEMTPARPPTAAQIEASPQPRRLFDALSVESLSHPEQSPLVFPTAYFNRQLQQELGARTTAVPQIRLGVVFVEPRASRSMARDGTVIGYFIVSLPSLPECRRQFGGPSYTFPNASTALMGAINDTAPDIANWLERASGGEELACPS